MSKKNGTTARAKVKAEMSKNPVGRPRTKVEDLPPDWKDIMRAEAQDGGSAIAMMVKLGIRHAAFDTLLEDSVEFRETYEECLLLQQYWWENQGKRMTSGGQGSAPVWALNMTNRFNWRSGRNEVVGDPTAPLHQKVEADKRHLTKEELVAELEARGLPTKVFESDDHDD